MKLSDILKGIEMDRANRPPALDIAHITNDSRAVREGSLFVAVKGHELDGSFFINDALNKGALAIVSETDFEAPKNVAKVIVRDSRAAVSLIADNYYGRPSGKLKTVGITGTNGKTTITYLIESILSSAGNDCGVIGTINCRLKDKVVPSKNTTPGPIELASIMAEMARTGAKYAVMEVSSHSLHQRRVDCARFDVGIFTNLTGDHLDYHGNIENYFDAKKRLFTLLKDKGMAVLNLDDPKVASVKDSIGCKAMTYSVEGNADIAAQDVTLSLNGSSFKVSSPSGNFHINTVLIGRHNVSNILAGIAAALVLGIDKAAIKRGVESFRLVPGRLESLDAGQNFKVLVDYAHTEDALYNILSLLREVADKKIITVFGCGGNRDTTKRPLMGKVACKYSDRVIITSDNPRFEEPSRIIAEIEAGVKNICRNYEIVPDRRSAIETALMQAGEGDVVVLAGKGHEDHQIIRDKILPFDDRTVAMEILKRMHEDKGYRKSNTRKSVIGRS